MEIISCKDETTWVKTINEWLYKQSLKYAIDRVFVPAGDTPRPLYRSWEASGLPFKSTAKLVQLDEILTGRGEGLFKKFFKETLPSFQKNFEYIDKADSGADIAILGLGPNGHVAFHEPGLSANFYSGCLQLNEETANRLKIEAGAKVVSYGLGAFMKSKGVILIVRGAQKKEILKTILKHGCALPAALLLNHKNVLVVTDF
jgi:6-phosphogluconolactonase/glucosamine-6-phosphate isomerase/deaminase